jgi:hypothetical protein
MGREKKEGAILWTPLLTLFAQMDTLVPKGLGVSTVWREGRKELEGSVSGSEIDIVGLFVGYFLWIGLRDDDGLMGWARNDGAILWTPLLTPLV